MRTSRSTRLACLTLLLAALACRTPQPQASSFTEPIALVISNDGYFDVAVYAVPSPTSSGTRIATVTGLTKMTVQLHANDLEAGQQLVLRLHAIGTRFWWTSSAISVDPSLVARLDIETDATGYLGRSNLYTTLATTSALDSR